MNIYAQRRMTEKFAPCKLRPQVHDTSALPAPVTLTWREKIAYLAYKLHDVEQTEYPLRHIFEPGKYIREIEIPAGQILIGREHRHGHLCLLLKGSVIMNTEKGRVRFDAPAEFVSQPGHQMVVQALTDVIARTVHPNPTESRDTDALHAEAFVNEAAMFALGHDVSNALDRQAYKNLLAQHGITPEIDRRLTALYADMQDVIGFPEGVKVRVAPSPIDGRGIFTTAPVARNERLCAIRVGVSRTPAGRFLNHSDAPNAVCVLDGGAVYIYANQPLAAGREVLVSYRDVLDTTHRLDGQRLTKP